LRTSARATWRSRSRPWAMPASSGAGSRHWWPMRPSESRKAASMAWWGWARARGCGTSRRGFVPACAPVSSQKSRFVPTHARFVPFWVLWLTGFLEPPKFSRAVPQMLSHVDRPPVLHSRCRPSHEPFASLFSAPDSRPFCPRGGSRPCSDRILRLLEFRCVCGYQELDRLGLRHRCQTMGHKHGCCGQLEPRNKSDFS
jgi:hypothetical protein